VDKKKQIVREIIRLNGGDGTCRRQRRQSCAGGRTGKKMAVRRRTVNVADVGVAPGRPSQLIPAVAGAPRQRRSLVSRLKHSNDHRLVPAGLGMIIFIGLAFNRRPPLTLRIGFSLIRATNLLYLPLVGYGVGALINPLGVLRGAAPPRPPIQRAPNSPTIPTHPWSWSATCSTRAQEYVELGFGPGPDR